MRLVQPGHPPFLAKECGKAVAASAEYLSGLAERDSIRGRFDLLGESHFGRSSFDLLEQPLLTLGFISQTLSSKNLRNEWALQQYADAAKQKLSSDINGALFDTAALGSVFVKRGMAPTGFDDVAVADTTFSRIGVTNRDRSLFLAASAYNGMASNLAKPQTSGLTKTSTAYEKGYVGPISGFDTFKNDTAKTLGAATGGAMTVNGAGQFWEPKATSMGATGETENVDNRSQNLTITAAAYANIKVGDAFTIAGVNAVNMITKQDTGQLQTYRVIGKPSAGVITIWPAIISNGGSTIGGKELQNATATPANGAAITWLNTTTAEQNPFFVRGAILLIPGSFAVDPEDGWNVMRATTSLGIGITYAVKIQDALLAGGRA
ncbi:P22 phage major capsid protein family protein [Sphingobium sp. CR2-8]|uniref:P22 phage major capsid protein family protein n=1 Tax=Sphingobium sp. CR2-8 TaxID=1306534 RepID=UPI003FA3B91B